MQEITSRIKKIQKDYQPIPFWSWNDELEQDELIRQIQWMKKNGIGGFFMHARGGLKTPYLSKEWMDCITACSEEADILDMDAWIYDENGWPSGFVGGKLLEDVNNHDMYIDYRIGPFDEKATVVYSVETEKLIRVNGVEALRKGINNSKFLNLYICRAASTVDILNPRVVEQFIGLTHEYYKEHYKEDFTNKIRGFFTDEPQYYRWGTPYTPMIAEYFQAHYGENILDTLGLLFVEKEGYRSLRYRYWHAMQALMLNSFAKKVFNWCDENGVELTGHYVEEVTLGYQIMCCAGVMPFYEYEHIPGIDWLGRDTNNELSPKQLGSAARQLGKKQTLTETFGCCGWDVSPGELRRIAGFQYACGVNLMCHHLVPYSEHGQRKRDYPAHFHPVNPWVKEGFKEFNDYFSRLGTLLAESEEPVNVAILHPIRSAYFDYKREKEEVGFGVKELDDSLHELCRIFSSRGINYHFLDETLLEKYGFVNGTTIGCGKCTYTYLVLPHILTMGSHTEKLLQQFVKNGGRVWIFDNKPEYLEGEKFSYDYLESNCTLDEIQLDQDFTVTNDNTDIYCAYRKIEGRPFLFLQNASGEKSYTQEFIFKEGYCSFIELDLLTLETRKIPLRIRLEENKSLLLFPSFDPIDESGDRKLCDTVCKQEYDLVFNDADVDFETNFLTLDMVSYSKDGIVYSEAMPRNRLFRLLLEERYEGNIWIRYDFEIAKPPKKLTLLAETEGASKFMINGSVFEFSQKCEDEPTLRMADITTMIHEGKNYYEVVMNWHQSEETYYALFGENVTESLKNCIAYDSEIENVYLAGKFGVYSHSDYEAYDQESVCSYDFYIGEEPKRVSDPTTDGFPFFRGKITMRQDILLNNINTILHIRGRYLTAKVWVNEEFASNLFFEHHLDISSFAVEGMNQIKVEFLVGNRNLLGPFHHSCTEDFVSPELFERIDLPDSEEGKCRYRLQRFYSEN